MRASCMSLNLLGGRRGKTEVEYLYDTIFVYDFYKFYKVQHILSQNHSGSLILGEERRMLFLKHWRAKGFSRCARQYDPQTGAHIDRARETAKSSVTSWALQIRSRF